VRYYGLAEIPHSLSLLRGLTPRVNVAVVLRDSAETPAPACPLRLGSSLDGLGGWSFLTESREMRPLRVAKFAFRDYLPSVRILGSKQMAIYRLLQGAVFDDKAVKAMTTAYEAALVELKLADRNDPLTETIARKIVEIAQTGERDPERLCQRALAELLE
jgi:hypothetical protein